MARLDSNDERATPTLHNKAPVVAAWSVIEDIVGDVKKSVEGEGAHRQSLYVELIISLRS